MADYNVKQISELLNVDSETVRRWIRTNKLKGTKDSKKTGFVVSESELKRFLNGIPKYSGVAAGLMAAAVPAVGVPIAVGTLLGSIAGSLFIGKGKSVTPNDITAYVQKEISKANSSIAQKQAAIQQLQAEIEESKKQIEGFQYLLENADFQQMSDNINNK